jgi:hypothetical protein
VIRLLAIVLFAGFLGAAGPELEATLPVPPIPPAHPPVDEAAPIPDADAHPPVTIASTDPSVGVELYRRERYDPSQGFVPGSQFQDSEDRKPIQTPGISVRVPLQ